jgi:hypothetical protein
LKLKGEAILVRVWWRQGSQQHLSGFAVNSLANGQFAADYSLATARTQ